jgi:hypothetical protein
MESSCIMHLTTDDLCELFEDQYQYMHEGVLWNFRALTINDHGEIYIEIDLPEQQLSSWVTLRSEVIYKRIVEVRSLTKKYNINDLVDQMDETNFHEEIDFGPPVGREYW